MTPVFTHTSLQYRLYQELYVKTEGRRLTVSARHEGRDGCKEFQESFSLPPGVQLDKINSALSKAGVLTISAPCESQPALPDKTSSALVQPKVVYEDQKLCIELDVKDYRWGTFLLACTTQSIPVDGHCVLQSKSVGYWAHFNIYHL